MSACKVSRVALAAALLAGAAAHDLTFRIGHAVALSGQIANVGWTSERGVRLALEELNAKGVSVDQASATTISG